MTLGFASIKDILAVVVIPISLAIIALVWPNIQAFYRQRAFKRLIIRELEETGPLLEKNAQKIIKKNPKKWVNYQTRNFVHPKIFDDTTANRDFILSLDPDLVYYVTQLWAAKNKPDSNQWLWYLKKLAESYDRNGEITKSYEKWKQFLYCV